MIVIDTDNSIIKIQENGQEKIFGFNTQEAFKVISDLWLRCGWDTKYVYSFSWLGRPIIQLPEDMMRIQEVIYSLKPDVIIETGVAHGGSLIFYASLCKSIGKGRIIGVDIEIRPHNRTAIESHELSEYITLLEGSSTDDKVVSQVKQLINDNETVLVLLDSNHTKQHVLDELKLYSRFVSINSYIVACDGIMAFLGNAPRTQDDWAENNPLSATKEFLSNNSDFVMEEPKIPFNEGLIKERVTYWPSAFLKRIK